MAVIFCIIYLDNLHKYLFEVYTIPTITIYFVVLNQEVSFQKR